MEKTIKIQGMTCGHCAQAVQSELQEIPGVTNVIVDLAANSAIVEAEIEPSQEALRQAVEEAGYTLTE